jgi:cellulose synthase/poly-beta-1,6-N-acetylglucosamine synthase-like glycosyltransferase
MKIGIVILIGLIQLIAGIGLLYHYILLAAGLINRRSVANPRGSADRLRFAVVVPAHNEESVIRTTVTRMLQMKYPSDFFDVHVVADHCEDATADMARMAGAIVHERYTLPRGRKGYPLAWIFESLVDTPVDYDAVFVFDADSHVAEDFLEQMNAAFADGSDVVQGNHRIANPDDGVFSALADADMLLCNLIRNQAKENLGLSARLMGDAMGFRLNVLRDIPFGADSLTEDREYGIHLITQGKHVRFVPEASSKGQAVNRWRDATGQRLRWYAGAFDLPRRYLKPLWKTMWRDQDFAALDGILELCLPSFSTLCVSIPILLLFQVAVFGLYPSRSFVTSIVLLTLALVYPLLGLVAARAPLSTLAALIYGPFYVVWRLWVGGIARLRHGRVPWTRTRRLEEEDRLIQ